MKRFILMLTISMSLMSTRSFAGEIVVSDAALSSFKTSFSNATEVTWTTFNEYYKVSFFLHEEYITVYYDKHGERIALTRNISAKQLPFTLQISLKTDYSNYWISDLFEVNSDEDGIAYYVTIENADSRIILKSSSTPEWTTFKKITK
jgi:hypothetical protein